MNDARTPVPEWAKTHAGPSEKQRKFILSLKDQKELTDDQKQWIDDNINKLTPGREGTASKCITRLLALKNKPTETSIAVPAGRYAIDNEQGELRFYQVWRPKDNNTIVQVYVLHGPDSTRVPGRAAELSILGKIEAAGVREAAIRFGQEIRQCSNCGRRLTNRISRELGIGPICGGRMFGGDDWKDEVKAARQAIIDRGEDPDEELDPDETGDLFS